MSQADILTFSKNRLWWFVYTLINKSIPIKVKESLCTKI